MKSVTVNIHIILSFKSLTFFFLLKEINTFIQQGCIKLIKSDYLLIYFKNSISNKSCSLEFSIQQIILKN